VAYSLWDDLTVKIRKVGARLRRRAGQEEAINLRVPEPASETAKETVFDAPPLLDRNGKHHPDKPTATPTAAGP
jgi:hypothetical protein